MHATTAWASSSYRTCSITVCSTPSSRFHTLADRTPFHPPWDRPLSSRNHRRGAACSHGRTGQPTHGSVTRARFIHGRGGRHHESANNDQGLWEVDDGCWQQTPSSTPASEASLDISRVAR